ncbi:MAG: hypothetical protein KC478_10850 [Bacteriovoracaceae bacterium]|nr:hypothetical protein [Bacteriovoracaceae bacterium]
MKLFFSLSLILISNTFATGDCQQKENEEFDFFSPTFIEGFAEKMANRSCVKISDFDKYDWDGDDLFEVETCREGAEDGTQFLEFQNKEEELCIFPMTNYGGIPKIDIKYRVKSHVPFTTYDFDHEKYCGMAGRDKLKIEGGRQLVLAVGRGVVEVYFLCEDYKKLARTRPVEYGPKAKKQCKDFIDNYYHKFVYLYR